MIPEGLKDQVETIIEIWRENDLDDEDLADAMCRFIRMYKPKAVWPKRYTSPEQNKRYSDAIKADPVKLARRREQNAASKRRAKEKDPEAVRLKRLETTRRVKEKDIDAWRAENRRRYAKRRANNPEYFRRKERRQQFRKLKIETQTEFIEEVQAVARKAVPSGYPTSVRDDIASAVVLSFLEGRITRTEAAKEAKSQTTAYNRMFDTFKNKSLDGIVPGTDSLRLIDTISNEHQRF